MRKIKETNFEDIKEKLKLFLENKTYTFLDCKNVEGSFYYNGYVVKISDFYILFNDDKLGKIPIRLKDIKNANVNYKGSKNKNGN